MQAYTQRTVPKYSQTDSLGATFTLLTLFHPFLGTPARTLVQDQLCNDGGGWRRVLGPAD